MLIKANDPAISWGGIISLQEENGSITPWRLPFKDLDLFPNQMFHNAAKQASCVRLRFQTNAAGLKLKAEYTNDSPDPYLFDLCIDNELFQTAELKNESGEAVFTDLPQGEKNIEIWCSPVFAVTIHGIELEGEACISKAPDKRLKWITYGSSITHCRLSSSPAMTWPGIVARKMNLDLTALGYGGQCKIDPMVARMIRDMPADFISLKLGINTYDRDLSPRTFPAAVIGSIAIIREKHKDTPLVVCSPIWSPPRETVDGVTGLNLVQMREDVKKAVESFQKRGDKNIYYVDGLKIFGPELVDYLPDKLHPDGKGMELMAENFIEEVFNGHKISLGNVTSSKDCVPAS